MIFHSFDVQVDFDESSAFDCAFGEDGAFDVDFGYTPPQNEYQGPYEVTPSKQEQRLETENMVLATNVVIKPIPSNYGLITYNGSTITVS